MATDPAADLTASQRDELQRQLVALGDDLSRSLADSRQAASPVALDQPIGRVSRIDAIQQQQMAQATREATALRATLVRAALERVADGSYGDCSSCGESVGYARLRVRPESPFCIACQSQRERR